jgi:hypothetical protein
MRKYFSPQIWMKKQMKKILDRINFGIEVNL